MSDPASDSALRRVFDSFDKDGSGSLDRGEVKAALEKLHLPTDHLDAVFTELDVDNSGFIDFSEFRSHVHSTEKELLRLFRAIDSDNSGTIEEGELLNALSRFRLKPSHFDVSNVFKSIDKDG